MNGQYSLFVYIFGFDVTPKMVFKRVMRGVMYLALFALVLCVIADVVITAYWNGLIDLKTSGIIIYVIPYLFVHLCGLIALYALLAGLLNLSAGSATGMILLVGLAGYFVHPLLAVALLIIRCVQARPFSGLTTSGTRSNEYDLNTDVFEDDCYMSRKTGASAEYNSDFPD